MTGRKLAVNYSTFGDGVKLEKSLSGCSGEVKTLPSAKCLFPAPPPPSPGNFYPTDPEMYPESRKHLIACSRSLCLSHPRRHNARASVHLFSCQGRVPSASVSLALLLRWILVLCIAWLGLRALGKPCFQCLCDSVLLGCCSAVLLSCCAAMLICYCRHSVNLKLLDLLALEERLVQPRGIRPSCPQVPTAKTSFWVKL